jgi:phosphoribosylformimino-5-aminoimidazole carboxamide ribotide isomerase
MTASLSTPSPTRREKELDMPPTFYPAVDLKDGKCVQLAPGVTDQPIRVCGRPSNASARIWQDTRFAWLQRGGPEWRFAGRPANASAIKAIL